MVDAAVREWLGKTSGADDGPTPRPMLLVGASGGGTKAAYWTTLILDLFWLGGEMPAGDTECGESDDRQGPERLQRLFLTSSVSGGSVGSCISSAISRTARTCEWIETRVGREVLSPLTAWGLVHDLPIFLLGWPTDPNLVRRRGLVRDTRRSASSKRRPSATMAMRCARIPDPASARRTPVDHERSSTAPSMGASGGLHLPSRPRAGVSGERGLPCAGRTPPAGHGRIGRRRRAR